MEGDEMTIIEKFREKLANGQNLFRRSTVEPLVAELGRAYKEATTLRDTLAIVDRNLSEMTANRDKLAYTLSEWSESYRKVISAEGCPDEQHCACVPALRDEVAALRLVMWYALDTLNQNMTYGCATILAEGLRDPAATAQKGKDRGELK